MPIDPEREEELIQTAVSNQQDNTYDPPGGPWAASGFASDSTIDEREIYDDAWEAARKAK